MLVKKFSLVLDVISRTPWKTDGFLLAGNSLDVAAGLINVENDIVAAKDKCGNTPWHLAVAAGHDRMLEFLLAAGCDLEWTNNAGCTAVLLAARAGK